MACTFFFRWWSPDPGAGGNDPVVEGIEKILGKDNVTFTGIISNHPMDSSKLLDDAAVASRYFG